MRQTKKRAVALLLGAVMAVGLIGTSLQSSAMQQKNPSEAVTANVATVKLTDEQVSQMLGMENYQRNSVHDPSIVVAEKDGNKDYYVFGSHMAVSKTKDLKNWAVDCISLAVYE